MLCHDSLVSSPIVPVRMLHVSMSKLCHIHILEACSARRIAHNCIWLIGCLQLSIFVFGHAITPSSFSMARQTYQLRLHAFAWHSHSLLVAFVQSCPWLLYVRQWQHWQLLSAMLTLIQSFGSHGQACQVCVCHVAPCWHERQAWCHDEEWSISSILGTRRQLLEEALLSLSTTSAYLSSMVHTYALHFGGATLTF